MYRNKILAIFTVMIVILLGVMIWSSNVVADHNAAKKSTENEQKGNVIGVEIPEEHRKDFITEESLEDSDAKSEEQVHDEIDGKKLVIDTNVDVPEIVPRVSSETRLDANYIDKIDFSKKLVLWNVTTFPLNICIKNENNLPEGIVNSIKIAFGNWERLSEGLVKFQYIQEKLVVKHINNATIVMLLRDYLVMGIIRVSRIIIITDNLQIPVRKSHRQKSPTEISSSSSVSINSHPWNQSPYLNNIVSFRFLYFNEKINIPIKQIQGINFILHA